MSALARVGNVGGVMEDRWVRPVNEIGHPPCTEQDVILTDAITDTLGTNDGLIDYVSTTYRVPTADTNLARALSMTRAS